MSDFAESRGTLYATALNMWVDYGIREPAQLHGVPTSELRLLSGLPFGLWVIDGEPGPQEGTMFAAVAGDPTELAKIPEGPFVRLHSACEFAEIGHNKRIRNWLKNGVDPSNRHDAIFVDEPTPRSEKCDCREQRIASQAIIATYGGVFVDLAEQEGRGHGIEIKEEIYRLHEEEGLDTVEACERLGIEPDIRRYDAAARFLLQDLGLTKIRLLTNNPRKIRLPGIDVTPVPLVVGVKPESIKYQMTKRDKLGHGFPPDAELLAQLQPEE